MPQQPMIEVGKVIAVVRMKQSLVVIATFVDTVGILN